MVHVLLIVVRRKDCNNTVVQVWTVHVFVVYIYSAQTKNWNSTVYIIDILVVLNICRLQLLLSFLVYIYICIYVDYNYCCRVW